MVDDTSRTRQPDSGARVKVLFATAELRPLVSVGGLAEAASGLVAGLRQLGTEVIIALPDYSSWSLDDSVKVALDVPDWAGPATARIGLHPDAGRIALVEVPGIARPNPYVDTDSEGWPDNDQRFGAFSAAVAALAVELEVDVVHLNDWHTSLTPAFLPDSFPTLLMIHNLAHQGWLSADWLHRLPVLRDAYQSADGANALAGALASVDRVVAVSPNYADEISTPEHGLGLDAILASRGSDLSGIRNGIDARVWDPTTDAFVPTFSHSDMRGKVEARASLLQRVGWSASRDPLLVMVTRLVDQKGVDLAFEAARFLEGMKARMIVLGSGDPRLAEWAQWLMDTQPERFWFHNGYDAPLSHLLFAGGDLFLMPSRDEPCGLAQMQAMAYGTIPIVTAVGGLVDTVVDADRHDDGTGFMATALDESGVVDAVHRSLRAVRHPGRRKSIQRRGMTIDWSWDQPAQEFQRLYDDIAAG